MQKDHLFTNLDIAASLPEKKGKYMNYKIGKFASILGVTTDAIRYYERQGLIVPIQNNKTNYRYYTEEHLRYLLYVMKLSRTGI